MPKLIVMLTHHDRTVGNAFEIFEQAKNARAEFWGMKEEPLPPEEMKRLYAYMHECGKRTALEVVAYTESACLAGAEMAAACGAELLMGTLYFDSVNAFCQKHGLEYLPFVGSISGRPSILEGSIDGIIGQAKRCLEKGVCGIDLLGYRYTGDASALNRAAVAQILGRVCIAGSVNSYQRLDELKELRPWAFTIGSAFFEHKFGGCFQEQIDRVLDYIEA